MTPVHPWLALIPLGVFVLVWAGLMRRSEEPGPRRTFLRAAGLWGIALVAITEGLSLIREISPMGLSLAWGALGLLLLAYLVASAPRARPIRTRWGGRKPSE